MHIIPVIDLQNGIVVHARHGDRNNYAPLKSVICKKTGLLDVIETYQRQFGFNTIYIADLNAITRQNNNQSLLSEVMLEFPGVCFWIDAGFPISDLNFDHFNNYLPVLGSESFQDSNINELKKFDKKFVLSLDFGNDRQLGAKALFDQDDLWPAKTIIMSLAKVGSNAGPDLAKLSYFCHRYPDRQFIAAGGIRNISDLNSIKNLGIEHALVATALHNGSINPYDVAGLI